MENGESRPTPDPTILTTEALERGLRSQRDYIDAQMAIRDQRLDGIDTATKLLNETVNRVPTALSEAITHLRELDEEKFQSVAQQFRERDVRSERESLDNKVAVDAAFAAQKEAAAKQDESNAKAIEKSEKATGETISSQSDKIDDLKARVQGLESRKEGSRESESDRHASSTQFNATAMVLIGIAAILMTLVVAALATHGFTK